MGERCESGTCLQVTLISGGRWRLTSSRRPDESITLDPDELPLSVETLALLSGTAGSVTDDREPTLRQMAAAAVQLVARTGPHNAEAVADAVIETVEPVIRAERDLLAADAYAVGYGRGRDDEAAGLDLPAWAVEGQRELAPAAVVPTEVPISLAPSRSTRFRGAAAGRPLDLVSFTAGSGRHYEGERSSSCPGDQPGHRHDVRCIRPTGATDHA